MTPDEPPQDPYGVPEAELDTGDGGPSFREQPARKVRRRYGEQEATVRSLGAAFMALSLALFFYGGVSLLTAQRFAKGPDRTPALIVTAGVIGLSLLVGFSGLGLSLLKPAGRVGAVLAGALLLLLCPCGTWLGIFALILLFSQSTSAVLSDDYRAVVAATPRERPRPSAGTRFVIWIPAVFMIFTFVLSALRFSRLGS
ncbi:MAG: hypothetical protein R3F62_24440 [Planctomycetota bacterium]